MKLPLVSVIMPTYNTNEKYLKAAIESILNQTYSNFELIIIDDGSKIDNFNILKKYSDRDSKIKLYRNEVNKGLVYTLNKALALASGKYIFRMDSDDISMRNRLKIVVNFMEKNSEIDIIGSNKKNIGDFFKSTKMPKSDKEIKCILLYQNPFVHPSVVFRKDSINKYKINYIEGVKSEDYNLWVTSFVRNPEIKYRNLNKSLIYYRIHDDQITKKDSVRLIESHKKIHTTIFNKLNIDFSNYEHDVYLNFVNGLRIITLDELYLIDYLFLKIISANNNNKMFDCEELSNSLTAKFAKECIRQYFKYGNTSVNYFFKSHISKCGKLPIKHTIALLLIKLFLIKKTTEKSF